jgi:hypothetical protein
MRIKNTKKRTISESYIVRLFEEGLANTGASDEYLSHCQTEAAILSNKHYVNELAKQKLTAINSKTPFLKYWVTLGSPISNLILDELINFYCQVLADIKHDYKINNADADPNELFEIHVSDWCLNYLKIKGLEKLIDPIAPKIYGIYHNLAIKEGFVADFGKNQEKQYRSTEIEAYGEDVYGIKNGQNFYRYFKNWKEHLKPVDITGGLTEIEIKQLSELCISRGGFEFDIKTYKIE